MSEKGFIYFCRKGTVRGVESEDVAKTGAEGSNGKYLPLPAGFRVDGGNVYDKDTRIVGELKYDMVHEKDRFPGTVTWDIETIQGNIRQYPALMAVAKELLA